MAKKTETSTSLRKALIPLALLVLRAVTSDPSRWWRDWLIVLAAYWAYSTVRLEAREWPMVTTTAMAYLLGIHVLGQLPHVLAVLGWVG